MGSKLVESLKKITCRNQYNDHVNLTFHESLEPKGIQKYQQIKIIFHQKFDVAEALSLKGKKYNIAIFDTKDSRNKFT